MRHTITAVFVSLLLALTGALPAQELNRADFRKQWAQGIELEDDKILDKAMKRGHLHAIMFYEELWRVASTRDDQVAEMNTDALMASWGRCFENQDTLTHVQRWVDGCTASLYKRLQSCRSNSAKIWGDYTSNVATGLIKKDFESCYQDFVKLARVAESIGHYQEAADLWGLASVVGNKMPGKTIEDREGVVFAIEQQLACKERWGYTFDEHYAGNKAFVQSELLSLKEARKMADKRSDEGYDANSKGLDALLMPNVDAKKYVLKFEALKDWKAADYGTRGGPVPSYWWLDSLGESGSSRKMGWFRQRDMYLLRRGANKFAVNWTADDSKQAVEIAVSPKAKPSTFYLGTDKALPYSMFFWIGTDAEPTGVAKCNYSATDKIANIYYRSASSWETLIETEAAVFYDDDASGKPGDGEPFVGELKSHIVGDPTGQGALVPMFDSMKIGKGKRVPYSQFAKLASGWHHLEISGGADIAVRPLNPEYVKSGKIKLSWTGPKSTTPGQLVIQGRGDYSGAIFDVAGGKPVEVPVGEYSVIWGRMTKGKGARLQTAQIHPTDAHKSFMVKAGETFSLEMGAEKAGFKLDFEREGDRNASVSALTICVAEKSGCKITAMHGIGIAADVRSNRFADIKGSKSVGAFQPFVNDQLIGAAANQYNNLGFMAATFPMPKGYRRGEMVLSFKLPADNMKVGLFVKKKHKFFGPLQTVWK
jgi:hypothetical protein